MARPQLRVYWDPERTGETRLIPNPTGVLVPTRRFHVVVENAGDYTATNCRGFIAALSELAGDSLSSPALAGRLPLEWACSGGQTHTDIEPGEGGAARRLCLCKVPTDSFFFHLVSPVGDAAVPRRYAPGRYRLTVTVDSENAEAASCDLAIEFAGLADSMTIEEIPQR